MPIYELRDSKDRFRLPSALEEQMGDESEYYAFIVRPQWSQWEHKSLQLSRDGVVHIRLEKQIDTQPKVDIRWSSPRPDP